MHATAAGSLLLILPAAYSLPACGGLLLSLWRFRRCQPGGLAATAVVRLVRTGDDRWRWRTRDGRWQSGQLDAVGVTGQWLLTFTLRSRRPVTLRLWRDSADPDALRRLRVQLRLAGTDG